MNNLSRHIEYLLTKHNCVIVPQLGGFVAHYIAARSDSADHAFLPPLRSVGFNPQLTLNDGLLVQSYMQSCGGSYNESLRLLEADVREMKQMLLAEDGLELPGIGLLSLSADGRYHFIPQESGIVSPSLYGLGAFQLMPLHRSTSSQRSKTGATHFAKFMKNEKEYTITINRDVANYVAAAVVALVFFLAWAVPGSRTQDTMPQQASVATKMQSAPQKQMPKAVAPTAKQPATSQTTTQQESPVTVSSDAVTTADDKAKQQATTTPSSGDFSLVMATGVSEVNGAALIKRLKDDGYGEGRMIINASGRRQIVYGHYKSEEEARNRLAELRSSDYFKQSWVTHTGN